MAAGELPVCRKELTTRSRLIARIFFWPLPLAIWSCRLSASAARSNACEALLDGLGAHERLEVHAEAVLELVEDGVLGLEVADLEAAEVIPHALELGDLLVERLADLAHLLLGAVLDAALLVALGALFLQGGEVGLELLQPLGDAGVALVLERLHLEAELVLEAGHVGVTAFLVDRDDHVGGEVDDLLEVLRRHVEQVAEAATAHP